jgi:hypothetical protein
LFALDAKILLSSSLPIIYDEGLKVSWHLKNGNTRRLGRNNLESFKLLDLVEESAIKEHEREVNLSCVYIC